MAHGVCDEIVDHLTEAVRLADYNCFIVGEEVDASCRLGGLGCSDGVERDRGEVDLLELQPWGFVETCEGEEIVDERRHARGFFFDVSHGECEVVSGRRGATAKEFGVPADRGQWGS